MGAIKGAMLGAVLGFCVMCVFEDVNKDDAFPVFAGGGAVIGFVMGARGGGTWYVHHWRVPGGGSDGFVDESSWRGTSPYGGAESLSGPYRTRGAADRALQRMR